MFLFLLVIVNGVMALGPFLLRVIVCLSVYLEESDQRNVLSSGPAKIQQLKLSRSHNQMVELSEEKLWMNLASRILTSTCVEPSLSILLLTFQHEKSWLAE